MQWDSVSRKKDKKSSSAQPSKDSVPSRGEFRGVRGGRGGRGGSGRGGATVRGRGGPHRGGLTNGHAARTGSPRPTPPVGDASNSTSNDSVQSEWVDVAKPPPTELSGQQNESTPVANAWTDPKPPLSEPSTVTSAPKSIESDVPFNVNVTLPRQAPKAPAPGPTKLSWAQIARQVLCFG